MRVLYYICVCVSILNVQQAKCIASKLKKKQIIGPLFDLGIQKSFLPLTVEIFLKLRESDADAVTTVFVKGNGASRTAVSVV